MLKALRNLVRRGLTGPSEHEAWLTYAEGVVNYTPDMALIQQYQTQLLFVPDELQDKWDNHHILGDAAMFMGKALTVDKFSMQIKDLGKQSFPVPLDKSFATPYDPVPWAKQRGAPLASIKGEMWLIVDPADNFVKLDKYRQNGVQFRRERFMFDIPYREVWHDPRLEEPFTALSKTERRLHDPAKWLTDMKTKRVPAWMYRGLTSYWDTLRDGLIPVKIFHPKTMLLPPYYSFTKNQVPRLRL
jgi:hypothetical protein